MQRSFLIITILILLTACTNDSGSMQGGGRMGAVAETPVMAASEWISRSSQPIVLAIRA